MIVGLFTELLAAGGVQAAGRHTAAVLSEIAHRARVRYRFLSLNDPIGEHETPRRRLRGFVLRAFGRSKNSFVLAAMRLAFSDLVITVAAHPNLATVAMAMKVWPSRDACDA